jgi:hypothetical protein
VALGMILMQLCDELRNLSIGIGSYCSYGRTHCRSKIFLTKPRFKVSLLMVGLHITSNSRLSLV